MNLFLILTFKYQAAAGTFLLIFYLNYICNSFVIADTYEALVMVLSPACSMSLRLFPLCEIVKSP